MQPSACCVPGCTLDPHRLHLGHTTADKAAVGLLRALLPSSLSLLLQGGLARAPGAPNTGCGCHHKATVRQHIKRCCCCFCVPLHYSTCTHVGGLLEVGRATSSCSNVCARPASRAVSGTAANGSMCTSALCVVLRMASSPLGSARGPAGPVLSTAVCGPCGDLSKPQCMQAGCCAHAVTVLWGGPHPGSISPSSWAHLVRRFFQFSQHWALQRPSA